MNLNDYFDPICVENIGKSYLSDKNLLLSQVYLHTQENKIKNIDDYKIAIIGVPDSRSEFKDDSLNGLLKIREYLYSLSRFNKSIEIIDLGNLKPGKTTNDQIIGLRDVLIELMVMNIIPVVLGSSEDIIYSNYHAYSKIEKKINLVSIDSKINITEKRELNYKSALWKIIVEENEALFSFTNIGYQTHFVPSNLIKFLSDHEHFIYRIGYIRSNIKEVEPIFRDSDFIGLNVSSVRQSDAFGQFEPSPNGYYGEEICQLARYSGLSSKLTSFGVYDYNVNKDINFQTAHLIGQVVWYFIDGYLNRVYEYPLDENGDYKKYIVNLDTKEYELVFYKSEKTNRWWVEIPSFKNSLNKNLLISCTYSDYQNASNGDVPERWLKFFRKLN